ncbi:MAG: LysM peptidoglycan-binding domain-containing protein [Bacteroidales bacterium]|nr:LysM peptidoglycan-binding domain-containing protein [Bacteroidales bacterium]
MKASGPTDLLRFDLVKGASHSRLGRVFYMSEPYEWFSKHSLADSLRTLDTTVHITDAGMTNAYKSMPGRRTLKVVEYKKQAVRQAQKPAPESRPEIAEGPVERTESSDSIYIVKAGDTLSKIAKMHGTTVDSLCEKSNITRRTILRIGRRIVL